MTLLFIFRGCRRAASPAHGDVKSSPGRLDFSTVGEKIGAPQWPHSDPAPLEPQVEQDQGDGLVSTLVYLTASLNKDK